MSVLTWWIWPAHNQHIFTLASVFWWLPVFRILSQTSQWLLSQRSWAAAMRWWGFSWDDGRVFCVLVMSESADVGMQSDARPLRQAQIRLRDSWWGRKRSEFPNSAHGWCGNSRGCGTDDLCWRKFTDIRRSDTNTTAAEACRAAPVACWLLQPCFAYDKNRTQDVVTETFGATAGQEMREICRTIQGDTLLTCEILFVIEESFFLHYWGSLPAKLTARVGKMQICALIAKDNQEAPRGNCTWF